MKESSKLKGGKERSVPAGLEEGATLEDRPSGTQGASDGADLGLRTGMRLERSAYLKIRPSTFSKWVSNVYKAKLC
jgi:hypothetical protein